MMNRFIFLFLIGWTCSTFSQHSTDIRRFQKKQNLDSTLFVAQNDAETESRSECISCIEEPLIKSIIFGSTPISDLQLTLKENLSESRSVQSTCTLFPSQKKFKNGHLSDFWAQELIGVDLVHLELENLPLFQKKNWIAVFETHITIPHRFHVQNVISNSNFRQAVLPSLDENQITAYSSKTEEEFQQAVEKLQDSPPSFINNSMVWDRLEKPKVIQALSKIFPPSILILAAGNHFPDPISSQKAATELNAVLVGNFSPSGFVNPDSNEGSEVHILAPAGDFLSSSDEKGNPIRFGGTSGAAPLVTGSLAAFEWLSGYHPTSEEVKILLEKTALPSIHSVFENPRKNGKGLLNSYKLAQTAKKLKEKCGNNKTCFQTEIRKPENYQFPLSTDILAQTAQDFPECSEAKQTQPSCEKRKQTLTQFRKALLLNPENPHLWEKLSCIYKSQGFLENAKGLDLMALSFQPASALISFIDANINNYSLGEKRRLIDVISRMKDKEKVLQAFKNLAKNKNEQTQMEIVYALAQSAPLTSQVAEEVFSVLNKHGTPLVQEEVLWAKEQLSFVK